MNGDIVKIVGEDIEYLYGGESRTNGVDPKAVITLDGKPATLADLKKGDNVQLSGQPAVKVTATRPTTKPPTPLTKSEKAAQRKAVADAAKAGADPKLSNTGSYPADPHKRKH